MQPDLEREKLARYKSIVFFSYKGGGKKEYSKDCDQFIVVIKL